MIDRDELLAEMKEEQRLRKTLRNLLELYFKEKEDKTLLEENRFRKIIRSLIKEATSADVPNEQPQRSTGINVLEGLLKNIIAIIEEDYKALTTSSEQRESFRSHILNGVENSLRPAEVAVTAGDDEPEADIPLEEPETDIALEEAEEDIEMSIDIDKEKDKFIPVRDRDMEPDPEEAEEPDTFQPIGGMNVTGRNFASITFNKIENQILDAYESLGDKEDRVLFEDYLLTNLKLYFDRFEEELQPTLPEPESPDYDQVKV